MRCRLPLVAALFSLLTALAPAANSPEQPLANSASAFLRAQAASPVKWQPWGEEAFARAAQEERPIYLFVGATYSELSAAMSRQTFANPDIAAFLNENFVCVLVDREELPAVAAQGQAYVRAVKQLSGWPLNLWLTPELQPFDGATYLPPSEEWGKEGFLNVAQRVAAAWKTDPAAAREEAQRAISFIADYEMLPKPDHLKPSELRTALQGSAAAWTEHSDAEQGGFGETPRHPEPEMIRFLLRGGSEAQAVAVRNLHAQLASALRDPVDGGFFRYTSDPEARLPYFQKRLNDQARVTLALLDAVALAGEKAFEHPIRATLNYVLSTLARPEGGFAAGEDATGGQAAAYYGWSYDELSGALGGSAARRFAEAHGATREGNVARDNDPSMAMIGRNILAGRPDPAFAEAAARLREHRAQRTTPALDPNVVTADQGLILIALARAGRELAEPRFTAAAERLAAYIQQHLAPDASGALRRLAGSPAPAGPEDYAAVALGLRALETEAARARAEQHLRFGDEQFLDRRNGILYTTPADLPRGIWLRLPVPASLPGDSLSAAPLRLLAGDPIPEQLAALLATQQGDASISASGDTLLALRVYVDRLP